MVIDKQFSLKAQAAACRLLPTPCSIHMLLAALLLLCAAGPVSSLCFFHTDSNTLMFSTVRDSSNATPSRLPVDDLEPMAHLVVGLQVSGVGHNEVLSGDILDVGRLEGSHFSCLDVPHDTISSEDLLERGRIWRV